nr:14603_t:CDS:2 [Entrophospora candida]
MFLLNYVAIAGRNLTVDNLKQKLEPYIIDTESQLRESLHGSSIIPDDVLDISIDKKVTEGQRGKCRLSELVPLEGQSDKYIEFEPRVVKSEHKKVLDANVGEHVFIFITDSQAHDDETYDCNEIVITSENRKDFYGDILAKMKLYCIG